MAGKRAALLAVAVIGAVVSGLALAYVGTPAPPPGLGLSRGELIGTARPAWAVVWLLAGVAVFSTMRRRMGSRIALALVPALAIGSVATTAVAHIDCQPNVPERLVRPLPRGVELVGRMRALDGEGPLLESRAWLVRHEGQSSAQLVAELVDSYRARGWALQPEGEDRFMAYHHPYVLRVTASGLYSGNRPDAAAEVVLGTHRSGVVCFR